MDDEEMMEMWRVNWGWGVGGPAFDTGSSVDSNSGGLKCRVFKKWTIPVLTSVKKTIMSLNHSSVNRLSFCSVSPCSSIWCTYVQISTSILGVLFKNLLFLTLAF